MKKKNSTGDAATDQVDFNRNDSQHTSQLPHFNKIAAE